MVPNIEFPDVGRADSGKKIDRWNESSIRARDFVRDVHDILVRADAVKGGNDILREFEARRPESECRVGGTAHGALLLGPAQGIEAQRRPVVLGSAARIVPAF